MVEVKGRAIAFWYWTGIGAVIVLIGWASWDWLMDGGTMLRIVAMTIVATGLVFAGLGTFKALNKRPVIVADEKGVLDRTGLPNRLLQWSDIRQFRLITEQGRQPSWLAIDLEDPARLIAKAPLNSGVILERFQEKYGTPCVIAVKTLDIEPHNLLERLNGALRQYKR